MDFSIRWFQFNLFQNDSRKAGGRSRKGGRRTSVAPFSHLQKPHGSALVMAAIFMTIAVTLITVGVQFIANAFNSVQASNTNVAEAEQVAQQGLKVAVAWFGAQTANNGLVYGFTTPGIGPSGVDQTPTVNPDYSTVDQAFAPSYSSTNSTLSYTSNSSIGIEQEVPLDNPVSASANYWGRYEVYQQGSTFYTPGAGSSVVTGVIAATPSTVTYNYNPYAVHDASGERYPGYLDGDGLVWVIYCKGYVYKRLNWAVTTNGNWVYAYNQAPNTILATAIYKTEIRKLALNLPEPTPNAAVTAAVYVQVPYDDVILENSETLLSTANQSPLNVVAVMGLNATPTP